MTHDYRIDRILLGDLCRVLLDHGHTFDELRRMTMTEIYDTLKLINDGAIKSRAEVEAEAASKMKKK
jgi:hypothetical protein